MLVNGDTNVEPDETFFVNLSNATNATIADSKGEGTILNDDGLMAPLTVAASSSTRTNAAIASDEELYGILAAARATRPTETGWCAKGKKDRTLADLDLLDLETL